MRILLFTVDALRAPHIGQYGYHRDTMPVLNRLIKDGAVFKQAFLNAPYTQVSIPSVHTSRYRGHGGIDGTPTIAKVVGEKEIFAACIGTFTRFKCNGGELVSA
jgi:arylsulfatase A-like enzyme